ncbi:MAG: hypothetical protein P1S60_03370 [Anaerolineae bacterium]|nr:hypothetical protein [Anaerolineae bacterium]
MDSKSQQNGILRSFPAFIGKKGLFKVVFALNTRPRPGLINTSFVYLFYLFSNTGFLRPMRYNYFLTEITTGHCWPLATWRGGEQCLIIINRRK